MAAKEALAEALLGLIAKFKNTDNLDDRVEIAREYLRLQQENIHLLEYDTALETPDIEVWRNIIGYEGVYQISNFGRVKTLEGFLIKNRKGGLKMAVHVPEKIRSETLTANGYRNVSLWRNGVASYNLSHRLVAIHFIKNPENLLYVLHIDDNPKNPHFKNLKWGTQSDNLKDCSNKNRGFKGIKNNLSKLSEQDVRDIRKALLSGMSAYKTAPLFGVTKAVILSIKHGKTWSHVK